LASEPFDVVVVGAGMTGAGCALDAAQRGLRVALVDAGDIAVGTSSKSSKMVHGGLRYLSQREFKLVRENLRERQRLLNNAPHLVTVLPFLIPLFGRNGVVAKSVSRAYATALRLYDFSGGWRIGQRYRRITRAETLAHLPKLNVDALVAGFLYFDARGDDARVALTIARTAAERYGAAVATYVKVVGFDHDASHAVCTVRCRDERSGELLTVRTRAVINASGVWADEVSTLAEREPSHRITPAKGVHVVVPKERMPADVAAVLTVRGDRRSVFVVPFDDAPFTYIGTTDTPYNGPLEAPTADPADVAYLLDAINAWTSADLSPADVTAVWAGLRPLLAPAKGEHLSERTADLSRRHNVTVKPDHVVHVTGGKWTTYRQMAEDAVDAVGKILNSRARCATTSLPLLGAPTEGNWRPSTTEEERLYHRYGVRSPDVLALAAKDDSLAAPLMAPLPYTGAEFAYACREEMACTLVDLLTRRTRAHLMDARAAMSGAETVSRVAAAELGWDEARRQREVADYVALCEHEFTFAGLALSPHGTGAP
jgi:glycerol-3-phosphate dehydrogenase